MEQDVSSLASKGRQDQQKRLPPSSSSSKGEQDGQQTRPLSPPPPSSAATHPSSLVIPPRRGRGQSFPENVDSSSPSFMRRSSSVGGKASTPQSFLDDAGLPPLGSEFSRMSIFTPGDDMSAKQHYGLSAWEKWIQFHRFPWKLLLHLLLIFFMTTQMLILNRQDAPYSRAMYRTFDKFFMPEGTDDGQGRKILFTNEDLLSSIRQATQNYFQLNRVSTVSFLYKDPLSRAVGLEPTPFTMRLWVAKDYRNTDIRSSYNMTGPDCLGPFIDGITSEIALLLDSILKLHLDMLVCNTAQGKYYRNCYCWRIVSHYEFRNGGNVRLGLNEHIECPCEDPGFWQYLNSDLNFLNFIILIVGVVYLFLIVKSMVASLALYFRVRATYLHHQYLGTSHSLINNYTWESLPLGVKLRFFSPWLILIFLGTAFTLASVWANFAYSKNFAPSVLSHKISAGLGCLMLWTSGLRYLKHYHTFYGLVPTLNAAVPRLLPFLSGFIPIFLGYAVLGMSIFGRSIDIFSTVPQTLKTLWGMMNGDELHNITNAAATAQGMLIAHIYMFSYIALAIYVVLNIIITTTEEAYFISKKVQRLAQKYLARALEQLDDMDQQVAAKQQGEEEEEVEEEGDDLDEREGEGGGGGGTGGGSRAGVGDSMGVSPPLSAILWSPPLTTFASARAEGGGGGEEEEEGRAGERGGRGEGGQSAFDDFEEDGGDDDGGGHEIHHSPPRDRVHSQSSLKNIETAENDIFENLLCLLIDRYKISPH